MADREKEETEYIMTEQSAETDHAVLARGECIRFGVRLGLQRSLWITFYALSMSRMMLSRIGGGLGGLKPKMFNECALL